MLQIAAFRGKGWVSSAIKLLTYSCYSHIGVLFTEDRSIEVNGQVHDVVAGNVIEAWKGGVKLSASLSERHTKGTPVDLFSFKTPLTAIQEAMAAQYLVSQIGKGYDYLDVARFVPIVRIFVPDPPTSQWTKTHVFCSELGLEAFAYCGRPLLERCKAWEVPPRDVPRSTVLAYEETVVTV